MLFWSLFILDEYGTAFDRKMLDLTHLLTESWLLVLPPDLSVICFLL